MGRGSLRTWLPEGTGRALPPPHIDPRRVELRSWSTNDGVAEGAMDSRVEGSPTIVLLGGALQQRVGILGSIRGLSWIGSWAATRGR